jgi:hypothetical protein
MSHLSMTESDGRAEAWNSPVGENWCIVKTSARCEKIVARRFEALGIPCYLPLRRETRRYGAETLNVERPLFDRYLFASGSVTELRSSDAAGSIREIHTVPNQIGFSRQLDNLARALAQEVPLEPQARLDDGIPVEVSDGRLKGLRGMVSCLEHAEHLVLQVDQLEQAYGAAICGQSLRVLDA